MFDFDLTYIYDSFWRCQTLKIYFIDNLSGLFTLLKKKWKYDLQSFYVYRSSIWYWAILLKHKVLRGQRIIAYHIFSSIWSSIKNQYNEIKEKSSWLIGNGASINFSKLLMLISGLQETNFFRAKWVWNISIPPSKSLLMWIFMPNPTTLCLELGCYLPYFWLCCA